MLDSYHVSVISVQTWTVLARLMVVKMPLKDQLCDKFLSFLVQIKGQGQTKALKSFRWKSLFYAANACG